MSTANPYEPPRGASSVTPHVLRGKWCTIAALAFSVAAAACLIVISHFHKIARIDPYAYTLFEHQFWYGAAGALWWLTAVSSVMLAGCAMVRGVRLWSAIGIFFVGAQLILRVTADLWVHFAITDGHLQFFPGASDRFPGF